MNFFTLVLILKNLKINYNYSKFKMKFKYNLKLCKFYFILIYYENSLLVIRKCNKLDITKTAWKYSLLVIRK